MSITIPQRKFLLSQKPKNHVVNSSFPHLSFYLTFSYYCFKSVRNIYGVLSKTQDKVDLIFSDGTFGNLPQGSFRTYYRTSLNDQFNIVPSDLVSISVNIPYTSKAGNSETISLTLELKYTCLLYTSDAADE